MEHIKYILDKLWHISYHKVNTHTKKGEYYTQSYALNSLVSIKKSILLNKINSVELNIQVFSIVNGDLGCCLFSSHKK